MLTKEKKDNSKFESPKFAGKQSNMEASFESFFSQLGIDFSSNMPVGDGSDNCGINALLNDPIGMFQKLVSISTGASSYAVTKDAGEGYFVKEEYSEEEQGDKLMEMIDEIIVQKEECKTQCVQCNTKGVIDGVNEGVIVNDLVKYEQDVEDVNSFSLYVCQKFIDIGYEVPHFTTRIYCKSYVSRCRDLYNERKQIFRNGKRVFPLGANLDIMNLDYYKHKFCSVRWCGDGEPIMIIPLSDGRVMGFLSWRGGIYSLRCEGVRDCQYFKNSRGYWSTTSSHTVSFNDKKVVVYALPQCSNGSICSDGIYYWNEGHRSKGFCEYHLPNIDRIKYSGNVLIPSFYESCSYRVFVNFMKRYDYYKPRNDFLNINPIESDKFDESDFFPIYCYRKEMMYHLKRIGFFVHDFRIELGNIFIPKCTCGECGARSSAGGLGN